MPNVVVSAGKAFGKCGAFKNGISALTKQTPESSLAPSAMREHSEKRTILEKGSGPPIRHQITKSADTLILDFQHLKL